MSTLKVNTIQDTSAGNSSTPAQILSGRAKAWCNMDSTGTESIRAHYNMSSFTDNGDGDFVMNFDTDLANADYIVVVSTSRNGDSSTDPLQWGGVHTKTTSNFGLNIWYTNSGLSTSSHKNDLAEYVDIVVFGV